MVLKFLFCILILAPLTSWGSYLEQARQKKLWEDPQWIKLGHYRKKTFSGYKSPLSDSFFISSEGATNPEEELLASIRLLFSPESAAQAQCRYLARTSWLKKVLNISATDLVSCPARDAWKKQLGAEEVYLIFASSDLNSAGSSFGHTFLRVHNPINIREMELLDYGINYAAMTGKDSGALYALKGLFGFYPGAYSMLPYYQKIREYTNLEGRNLWEYRLDLSSEQVSFLIDHLLELEGSYAPYYFSDDNCSQQILELIEVAKPDLDVSTQFHDITIPLDTVKALEEKYMLIGEKVRVSLQTEWQERYIRLNVSEKSALKEIVHLQKKDGLKKLSPKEQAETLEASLSYIAIKEYREQKERKEEKYALSIARAQLGNLTEPVTLATPRSPLLSTDSNAFYFGYGTSDEHEFYRFKYRRGFHDLLSDDSGLSPFSHLEFMSFDFRYFSERQNLDLFRWTLLKIFSSAAVNELDTPLTWQLDIGTSPRFSPYVDLGTGLSFDFFPQTRFSLLGITENKNLADTAQPHLGLEGLFMWKSDYVRTLLFAKYLHNTSSGKDFPVYGGGLSISIHDGELRFEAQSNDSIPEYSLSVVF